MTNAGAESPKRFDLATIVIGLLAMLLLGEVSYMVGRMVGDYRLGYARAVVSETESDLFKISLLVENYYMNEGHYPIAQDAPVTRSLVYAAGVSPTWSPPVSYVAPKEPFRLTVDAAYGEPRYRIVAPGTYAPELLSRYRTAQNKPCERSCTRLARIPGETIGF